MTRAPTGGRHLVLVIGAGYAGLAAAKRLGRKLRGRNAQVTLVDRNPDFTERVRLHQVAAGQSVPSRALTEVLRGSGVGLRTASVRAIDLRRRVVALDDPVQELSFDTLVYALGSSTAEHLVPGVADHAVSVGDLHQASRARRHLAGLGPDSRVVIVGGGLTGIETAAELAESRPDWRIALVCDGPVGGWLSAPAQRHLQQAFAKMGIRLYEGRRVQQVRARSLQFSTGAALPADAVVWAAGFQASGIAAASGLATDANGRILVGPALRSVSHPMVYGVGDAAAATTPAGLATRMSCQIGLPMGTFVAAEIARTLAGRRSRPFRARYVWQNISIGRHDGITQFTRRDDSPLDAVLTGRISACFKESITRAAAWTAYR